MSAVTLDMDQYSEMRLAEVHPKLAEKVRAMADLLVQENITIRVVQGLRSWGEQAGIVRTGPNRARTGRDQCKTRYKLAPIWVGS